MDLPEYRIFKTMPLPSFAEQVRAHIREHGQPELIGDLRHDPIHKDEYFEILAEIDIDQRRRPEGDLAPCPMCQPNKFLRGRLCWFPALQCCAIIGHCCANKQHSAEAEQRFKEASLLKWQEDYFLAALPLVPEKIRVLGMLRTKAEEAERLHRKFRKDAARLMMLLRDEVKGGGRLTVLFEIKREASEGSGPQGFRGSNRVFDTHDHGVLNGLMAIRARYTPTVEIDAMLTELRVWNVGSDEDRILDAIVSMDQRQRNRGYAVLTNIDHKKFPDFRRKIEDFEAFFESENLARLDTWGRDTRNSNRVEVVERLLSAGRQVEIRGASSLTRLVISDALHLSVPEWPAVAKRN